MFKCSKYKNLFVSLLSILLIITLVSSVFIYRMISRKVINSEVVKITIEKASKYYDFEMNEEKKKELNENLNDYVYIIYEIDMRNISDKIHVSGIGIKPQFSEGMNGNVYWYAGTYAIYDSQKILEPNQEKDYARRILVKRNGLTDDELINMAKEDRFKITYYTSEGSSIFSLGYESQLILYEGQ